MVLSRSRIVVLMTAVFVLTTAFAAVGTAAQVRETPPEMKALAEARAIEEPQKKLEALQKVAADFGKTPLIGSINMSIVETLVKNWPEKTDQIIASATRAIESASEAIKGTYCSSIASMFIDAGILLDKAEQFVNQGIKLLEEDNAKRLKTMRASFQATLGRVYVKQGKTAEAEKVFKQAYEANPSLSSAALGLAELAEKAGNNAAALEYLANAALSGRFPADARKRLEAAYAKTHGGSAEGLEAMLDAKYRAAYPAPVKIEPYNRSAARSNRIILAEVFTGSGCPPCVAADLGFDAAMQRYARSDLAVLMYHLHIPVPDPMTNPSTDKRADFYGIKSVPTFLIDGVQDGGGGGREQTSQFYDRIRPKIDKRLEAPAQGELKVEAALDQNLIKVKANVSNVKSEGAKLRLHIALAEDEVTFNGENGVRFHPMVVRSLAGEKADGFVLDISKPAVEHVFDLAKISDELKASLDNYEVNGRHGKMTFAEKKHKINREHLSVVAFIQDEQSKSILQAVQIKVKPSAVASNR